MEFDLTDDQRDLQQAVTDLCGKFPGSYWVQTEGSGAYPQEFVDALTKAGWLSILIPEEYGGGGLQVSDAAVVLEAIDRNGCSSLSVIAQMYIMGAILRHGSDEQKNRYLPDIAAGDLRLQAFGVTEPDAGSDTTRIRTRAERRGNRYIINGQKIFTSRFEQSDLMLLLARTTPYEEVERKYEGISVFIVDLREAGGRIKSRQVDVMLDHHTYELFFDDLEVPVENLIGEVGKGFRYILSGLNSERVLVASQMIGNGYYFIDRAAKYGAEREVFGRPIGMNQGLQFPLAQAFAQLEAASLVRWQAAAQFEAGVERTHSPNVAKLLASQAQWAAANAAMDMFGGYGLAKEYGIESKFRTSRLQLVAPLSNQLILAQLGHGPLGLPKSY